MDKEVSEAKLVAVVFLLHHTSQNWDMGLPETYPVMCIYVWQDGRGIYDTSIERLQVL